MRNLIVRQNENRNLSVLKISYSEIGSIKSAITAHEKVNVIDFYLMQCLKNQNDFTFLIPHWDTAYPWYIDYALINGYILS